MASRTISTEHRLNGQTIPVPKGDMKRIKFTVDSALLRELGERLVGKAYIALAELVKNSYDADATKVVIRFHPDSIEVIDNGHGMDFEEFRDFWMRVGSQHKQEQKYRYSRGLGRAVTGSKGVGRLAVQFLANNIRMNTVSDRDTKNELEVIVDWNEAVQAGDLTEAEASYHRIEPTTEFPEGKRHGTAIYLMGLNQTWTTEAIVDLAKEIWPLQPPFHAIPVIAKDQPEAFTVELQSPDQEAVERFDHQMHAIINMWTARMTGQLFPASDGKECKIRFALEFIGEERLFKEEYSIPDCNLHFLEFEIRVFTLERRQPFGIRVDEARSYFKRFGGVHVYDAGFRLPYYGMVSSDWLHIQYDQASRLHKSQLLPDEYQVPRGLQFLPTTSRMFGIVHVNTPFEQEEAQKLGIKGGYLTIQVTRDRLVDNEAYRNLWMIIRWAVDYYAMREASRHLDELATMLPIEPISQKIERVDDILKQYREDLPKPIYETIRTQIRDVLQASEAEAEITKRQTGLLGALATAGMSALAYEHEAKKLNYQLWDITKRLEQIKIGDAETTIKVDSIVQDLHSWLNQSRAIRSLFTSLLDEDNRSVISRFEAHKLISDVSSQLGIILRGVKPTTYRVTETLRLPTARYAEWSAIFQNVFINAVNAMLDSPVRKLNVSSKAEGRNRMLLIQDTGVGVDLETSEELFKPFARKLEIAPERKALGLGGAGLGLTIVRMIAESIGCKVSFVKPESGFNTAFLILWREIE